jgi:hypothetical protein
VVIILGVDENQLDIFSVQMFPNPARNELMIHNPKGIVLEEAIIYDINGKMVTSINLRAMGEAITVDISNLASAMYTVVIKGSNLEISKRLIKE